MTKVLMPALGLALVATTLAACQTDLRIGTGGATGGNGGNTGGNGTGGNGAGGSRCTTCGGACITPSTDAHNCGRCGHDCLGGTCMGGACQPITLATGAAAFGALAVDAQYVYWRVATGAVMKVDKTATVDNPAAAIQLAPPSGTIADVGCPWALAIDPTSVYWADGAVGRLSKVPLDGGAATVLATEPGYICAVALNAANIYYTNRATGTVTRMDLDGGDAVDLATQQDRPSDLALDATNVYWVNSEPTAIMKVALGGGTPVGLATTPWGDAGPLAIDARYAYWVTSANFGSVIKVPLNGGPPTVLADLQGGEQHGERAATIAVNGDAITWGYASKGEWIMTISSSGGLPTPLVLEPATAIAADDAVVYFTTGASLKKVAR